jgi:hypothetical protein
MSQVRANSVTDAAGTGAPDFPNGLTDNSNAVLNSSSSLPAANLTGTLPAIDGSALTNLPAPSTAQVGTATAGLAYGAVGSYGLFQCISAGQRGGGSTVAASSLYPANAFSYSVAGYASVYGQPSGTWRLMGSTGYYSGTVALTREDMHTSVWLRIS